MSNLTIVAHVHADAEKIDLVRTELEKLIPITRAEKGCIQYALHQDNNDPAQFVFYENWRSRALWQRHISAPHLAAYLHATDGAMAAFTRSEMSVIG